MNQDLLLGVAARSGGVLLTERALALGMTHGQFRRILDNERWQPIHYGAWAPPGTTITHHVRLRAFQQRHPCLVASHWSAAAVLGIDDKCPTPQLTCTQLHGHHLSHAAAYRLPLPPAHIAHLDGIAVTTAARTACDLATALVGHDAVIAVDSILRTGRTSKREIATVLSEFGGRRGRPAARVVLARCDPGSGSPAETKARLVLCDGGLHPRTQAPVATFQGTRYLDLLLEEPHTAPLGIEIEGFAYHGSRVDHRRDVHRFNAIGYCRILRFTSNDVFDYPMTMLETVRRTLSELRLA